MPADDNVFDASQKPDARALSEVQWDYLAKGIDYIMAHPQGLSGLGVASANLYTVFYDWNVNSRSLALNANQSSSSEMMARVGRDGKYLQIQEHLTQYFRRLYPAFQSLAGTELLAYYDEQFDLTQSSAKILNRVFNYLNRMRAAMDKNETMDKNQEEIKKHSARLPIFSAVMYAWKTSILDPLQTDSLKVTTALLSLISAERSGKQIDVTLVKRIVDSFLFLGEHLEPNDRHRIYKDNFEARYLEDFEEYCKRTLDFPSLQGANDQDEYRKMVEDLLELEAARIGNYLPTSTQSKGASRVKLNVMSIDIE